MQDHGLDRSLGQRLAALVHANGVFRRKRRGLIDRARRARQFQGGNAARMDDALGAGSQRFQHEVAGAVDIGAQDGRRIARPEPVVGRDMEEVARAAHGGAERRPIGQIADNDLAAEVGEVVARAVGTDERPHLQPTSDKRPRHRRAEKAGSSRHQDAITRPQGCVHQSLFQRRNAYSGSRTRVHPRFRPAPHHAGFSPKAW